MSKRWATGALGIAAAGLVTVASFYTSACAVAPATSVPTSNSASLDSTRLAIAGGVAALDGSWPMVGWLDSGCTGVLIAPDLVVSAGHCGPATTLWLGNAFQVEVDNSLGTARAIGAEPGSEHRIAECQQHPSGDLATGTDIGWCRLAEPAIDGKWTVPLLLGCARAALAVGDSVTLVGFGEDEMSRAIGSKRQVHAKIVLVGRELQIGDNQRGTCAGDSGGPAFVQLGSEPESEWQLAGILSSGIADEPCGAGYYTDLASMLGWLETSTASDLSPCGSVDGAWVPTGSCRRAGINRDGQPVFDRMSPSSLCGNPFFEPSTETGCAIARGASLRPLGLDALLLGLLLARGARRRAHRQTGLQVMTAQRM